MIHTDTNCYFYASLCIFLPLFQPISSPGLSGKTLQDGGFSCNKKVYLVVGAESKAEVDGFDKEGALLVALPSSHSLLLGSGVGNKKDWNSQENFPNLTSHTERNLTTKRVAKLFESI